MILAGVDLAWQSERNPSAIAQGSLADGTLTLTALESAVFGINEVFKKLNGVEDLQGIAIDAPLIINNIKGQRPCEKQVGKTYGSRGASCHTSNTRLYPDARSVHLSEQLRSCGFDHLKGGRWQIECYPHPAIIEIFGLPERLKYKKGRVAEKKEGQAKLASHLRGLRSSHLLKLEIPSQYEYILEKEYIGTLGGQALKSNEDALDAIVCLYIAGLYTVKTAGQVFGDTASGYIWVPGVACAC